MASVMSRVKHSALTFLDLGESKRNDISSIL